MLPVSSLACLRASCAQDQESVARILRKLERLNPLVDDSRSDSAQAFMSI